MKYNLTIDAGKPYTITVNSKRALRRKIRKMDRKYKPMAERGELPYFDSFVRRVKGGIKK